MICDSSYLVEGGLDDDGAFCNYGSLMCFDGGALSGQGDGPCPDGWQRLFLEAMLWIARTAVHGVAFRRTSANGIRCSNGFAIG